MSYLTPKPLTPKITLEEHFLTEYFNKFEDSIVKSFRPNFRYWMEDRISEFTEKRLESMDEHGIEIQVLSLTVPGIQAIKDADEAVYQAKSVNDFLAEITFKSSDRFAGFASLPCQNPQVAADELERAVTQLGLKGALINGHTNGEYLDQQKFWCIWERAESLGVPIYLHPNSPVDQWKVMEGYPELTKAMWGWGVETATHTLRIILSGLFDRFPKSTLVLGHMGETLPFTLQRLDDRFGVGADNRNLEKSPSQYIRDNIMVTTSGVCSPEALLCTQLALGTERIMFSVDYPYQCPEEATKFIESAPLSPSDLRKICYENAKKLLNL
jgi:2,3-dihydroxybenzoate decarboxylase